MKGEVNETSCPGASALPSLNMGQCSWSHAADCGSFQKTILKAAQVPEVTGQRHVAPGSPRCLALPLSGRAVCALALQSAQEQGHFWLAAVLSPAAVDPLAAVFLEYCSQLLSLCLKSHAAVPARDGGRELGWCISSRWHKSLPSPWRSPPPHAVLWFGHLRSDTVTLPFAKCTDPIPGF